MVVVFVVVVVVAIAVLVVVVVVVVVIWSTVIYCIYHKICKKKIDATFCILIGSVIYFRRVPLHLCTP